MRKSFSAGLLVSAVVLSSLAMAQGSPSQRRSAPRPGAAQQPITVLRRLPAPTARPIAPIVRPPGWSNLSITIGNKTLVPVAANNLTVTPPPGFTGVQNLSLFVTATGDTELFLLGTPAAPQVPAPLLVGCHIFGSSHGDLLFHTDYFAEAFARGWYVLAPLARSAASDTTANFGERRSIVNATAAFDWVLANRNIDTNRIYGVGFSMGGGTLGSFMTHNLDPERGMLAAWAALTSSVDQSDTYPYLVGPPDVTYLMDELFGGPPSLEPFEYRRASLVQLDDVTHLLTPGGLHLAYNLEYAPCQLWSADQDPLQYLVNQTDQLDQFLLGLPGADVTSVTLSGTTHTWETMSESAVCSFLATHSLVLPTEGRVLADEDRRYFHFDIELDAAGQFGDLTFVVDAPANRLALTATAGIVRVITDTVALGLDPGQLMRFELEPLDIGDELVVRNVPNAPSSVLRDGIAPPAGGWVFDMPAQTLTIIETETGPHVWEVQ